ncbi:MAG: glycosyltransferase family 39 protein [Kofleriaceae bacterium]
MSDTAATLSLSRRSTWVALVAGGAVGVTLWLRLRLGYNGPHLDESTALYLSGLVRSDAEWNTYEYVASSHIPMHVLGLGERLGGLVGARAVALVLGAGSLGFVFGAARALLGSARAAACAALILALAAPHVFLSELATYDVVAFFGFSCSLWLLLAGLRDPRWGWLLCMLSSVALAAAVLSRYVVIAHAPIVALVVAVRRPRLLAAALLPCGLLLADYVYHHATELTLLYQRQLVGGHAAAGARAQILLAAARYVGPPLLLVLASAVGVAARVGPRWRALRFHALALALGAPLLGLHLLLGDPASLYRHVVYPIAALALLGGSLLHRLGRRRPLAASAVLVALSGLSAYQTRQLQRGFVDLRPVIAHLAPRLSATTTILSEDGYVFRYAFPERGRGTLYEFSWFDNDGDGQRTSQDVVEAIWDGKPDYVLTLGQLTPSLTAKLRAGVLPHRYRKVYERAYELSGVMTRTRSGAVELWKRSGTYHGLYPLGPR